MSNADGEFHHDKCGRMLFVGEQTVHHNCRLTGSCDVSSEASRQRLPPMRLHAKKGTVDDPQTA